MSRRPLQRLVARLRSGFVRAFAPVEASPAEPAADVGLMYLNEATLLGISVPAPWRKR